jgi:peptidyl-tRNA hydrolase
MPRKKGNITSRYVMREFTKGEAKKLELAVKEIMKNVP